MNRNVNGRQFEQLSTFEPLKKIINEIPKGDSSLQGPNVTPRDQWVKPDREQRPTGWKGRSPSLRDAKLMEAHSYEHRQGGTEHADGYGSMIAKGETPPVTLFHYDPYGDTSPTTTGTELTDGHHRLAHLEQAGHTEIPVEHEGETDDEYYSPHHTPTWRHR